MPANLQKVKKTEPVTTAKEQPAVEVGLELEPELEPEPEPELEPELELGPELGPELEFVVEQ